MVLTAIINQQSNCGFY